MSGVVRQPCGILSAAFVGQLNVRMSWFAVVALSLVLPVAGFASSAEPAVHDYSKTAVAGEAPITRIAHEVEIEPAEGVSPLSINLSPALGLPGEDWDIFGLRINLIAGRSRDVYGFDFGLVYNDVKDEFNGLQVSGVVNVIGRSDGAIQLAGILNRCRGDYVGCEFAAVNDVSKEMVGLQVGLFNWASVLSGVQLGLVNMIGAGSGLQIGLVNSARELDGLQIGIVNVIKDSTMPFAPLVNFAF